MRNRRELPHSLVSVLKELYRERQYSGLKQYVRSLKKKKPLNGKERFILKGATAYLSRLQADRRARSLGLVEYTPYDERECEPDEQMQAGFLAWDMAVHAFGGLKL